MRASSNNLHKIYLHIIFCRYFSFYFQYQLTWCPGACWQNFFFIRKIIPNCFFCCVYCVAQWFRQYTYFFGFYCYYLCAVSNIQCTFYLDHNRKKEIKKKKYFFLYIYIFTHIVFVHFWNEKGTKICRFLFVGTVPKF